MGSKATTAIGTAGSSGTRGRRLRAVGASVLAVVVGWILIEVVAGIDLRAPAFDETTAGQDVGIGAVIFVGLIASLSTWALLAGVERYSRRSRSIWLTLTIVGLLLSLGGPLSGTGINSANRGLLVLLHMILAATLIPLLYRTTNNDRESD